MSNHIGNRVKKKINMLQNYDEKRWHRWWSMGRKDGMTGVYRQLRCIPKLYRHAYRAGVHYGAMCREAGHDVECSMRVVV